MPSIPVLKDTVNQLGLQVSSQYLLLFKIDKIS